MLTDTEDGVTKIRKHRSISKQHRLNRSPLSKNAEIPRRKHRSSTKKRTDSTKLTRDEIKYQRFVNGLNKDVQCYLNKCLRESRFDPSGNQDSQINCSIRTKRLNETNKIVTTITNHRQILMRFSKSNETKRLTADIQTILTGPGLKDFYAQFIQSRDHKLTPITRLRPLEESILWSNEPE